MNTKLEQSLKGMTLPQDYLDGRTLRADDPPDNILCYLHTSNDKLAPDISSFRHCHHRFQLIYILEGKGIISVDNDYHFVQKGHWYLIHPHQVHYYSNVSSGSNWLFISFEIHSNRLEKLRGQLRLASEEIEDKLADFVHFYQSTDKGGLKLSSMLQDLLQDFSLAKTDRPAPPEEWSELLRQKDQIDKFIEKNIAGDLSVQSLANHLGFSENYFKAFFKKNFMVNPGQYVRLYRISYSTNLLRHTDSSIDEIAELSGFDNLSSFVRCFKTVMAKPPGKYRQVYFNTQQK